MGLKKCLDKIRKKGLTKVAEEGKGDRSPELFMSWQEMYRALIWSCLCCGVVWVSGGLGLGGGGQL